MAVNWVFWGTVNPWLNRKKSVALNVAFMPLGTVNPLRNVNDFFSA